KIEESMTISFVSLILIEFFKACCFRSDRITVFRRPFENNWLNLSILGGFLVLVLIVYLPFLHEAFGTYSLPAVDWAIIIFLAFTVSPVLEITKWMVRRGWLGKIS
ncbi:MAG: ATPase, partial [Chloroflexi bacterium]|nr:ATPase [Chloroflexota bacterium]